MNAPLVYFLRPIGAEGPVKIGSSRDPWGRLTTYRSWSPIPLELVATIPGNVHAERGFHAMFADLHSHHEWFHASPRLTAVIEAVRAGTFDLATLPAERCLTGLKRKSPESVEAAQHTRRLQRLARAGVAVPGDVWAASRTYGLSPEEKAARRAIVRAFVLRHAPWPALEAA